MSTIEITAWGHSAVRFARGGHRLVIDPGVFSDQAVLEDADAVLITHEHADHVVPHALAAALTTRTDLEVWGPATVVAQLTQADAPAERVHESTAGDEFTAAGFTVRTLGGEHAVVHPTLPTVANVAYLVEEVALHPGDSFTLAPDGQAVQALFLPISAPWLKLAESVEYARQVGSTLAIPIHDAVLSDPGRALMDQIVTALLPELDYRRLAPGESLSLTN
jgi:L-ascorbate metabolism protein UlaG (beta-lactamase superfamily)